METARHVAAGVAQDHATEIRGRHDASVGGPAEHVRDLRQRPGSSEKTGNPRKGMRLQSHKYRLRIKQSKVTKNLTPCIFRQRGTRERIVLTKEF